MNNNKIIILYSGSETDQLSADNQDTLIQLQEISIILETAGYQITTLAFSGSLDEISKTIIQINPKCIFNLVETVKHTDRLQYIAAALIEYLGYKYTGCPAWSLATLASKTTTKKLLLSAGLPTPAFIEYNNHVHTTNDTCNTWIIKPDTEHASFGLDANSIIQTGSSSDELIKILADKHATNTYKWFAEQFISGREFNVSILDNGNNLPNVLTPVEMVISTENKPVQHIGNKIIDYNAKWVPESANYDLFQRRFTFADDDIPLLNNIKNICQSCWQLFGLKGAARIDFRIDEFNNPWVIDINPNPCLAADAGLVAAAQYFAGLSQKDLILKLITTI